VVNSTSLFSCTRFRGNNALIVNKKLDILRSALEHHKQVGKELIPPFQQLGPGTEQIFWLRDLLPEFLWIDALVQEYGQTVAVRVFRDFLTAADAFNSHPKSILDGTVGAFRFVKEDRRKAFVGELATQIVAAVQRPFGDVLSLYPTCPMAWMLPSTTPEHDKSISAVRNAVLRLYAGKDPHAGFCRALPLSRFLAHQKVYIASHMTETIEAIKQYPHGDTYHAESFARSVHNMTLMAQAKEDPETFGWARAFWRGNLTIVPCRYE
jgi:hypothetical protein